MDAIVTHLEAFGCAGTGELITDPRGGPTRRSRISEACTEAKKAVGVDPETHPHDLRHHATALMTQMPGITTKELMARIGHSFPRAAPIYQHATAERDRQVAAFPRGATRRRDPGEAPPGRPPGRPKARRELDEPRDFRGMATRVATSGHTTKGL